MAKKKKIVKKKVTKKRAVKKRVGTSQTKKSTATKKAPSKRLKKRRAKNTVKGFYPNPKKRKTRNYVLMLFLKDNPDKKGYWTGAGWDTSKTKAAKFASLSIAKTAAYDLPRKHKPNRLYGLATEPY